MDKNKTKVKIFFLIFLCFLIISIVSSDENEVKLEKVDYKKKTIAELFDIGGKPTGSGYMDGMPWSLDELKNRPAYKVKTEAIKRLKNKLIQPYDKVFAVYCLDKIFSAEEIETILHKYYSTADSKAQYEILLYACNNNLSSFSDHFRYLLKNRQGAFSNFDMLAVLFFTTFPDKQILENLKKLEKTEIEKSYFLDGFPYSDLVMCSVENPRERISEALKAHEYSKESKEEKRLLKTTRNMILKPLKTSVSLNDLTGTEAITYLNSIYNQQIVPSGKLENKGIMLKLEKASLHEVLASICNSNSISIGEQITGYSLYNSSLEESYHWANNGVLASIRFISRFSNHVNPSVVIKMNLGIPWLNFPETKFSEVRVIMPDESIIKCRSENYFCINMTKDEYTKKGGYIKELSAQLHVPVPTVIKRKTILYEDAKNYDAIDFGRKVKIIVSKINEDEYVVEFESKPIHDRAFSFSKTYCDLGTIIMLDKNGKQISGDYQQFHNLKSGYTVKVYAKPESFLFTVATEVEYIKMPISFKNIKLQEEVWK